MVRDLALSRDDVVLAMRANLLAGGWIGETATAEEEREVVREADWLLGVAERLPTGLVVGRRLDQLYVREPSLPA